LGRFCYAGTADVADVADAADAGCICLNPSRIGLNLHSYLLNLRDLREVYGASWGIGVRFCGAWGKFVY